LNRGQNSFWGESKNEKIFINQVTKNDSGLGFTVNGYGMK
jgi:hypothetical protein